MASRKSDIHGAYVIFDWNSKPVEIRNCKPLNDCEKCSGLGLLLAKILDGRVVSRKDQSCVMDIIALICSSCRCGVDMWQAFKERFTSTSFPAILTLPSPSRDQRIVYATNSASGGQKERFLDIIRRILGEKITYRSIV